MRVSSRAGLRWTRCGSSRQVRVARVPEVGIEHEGRSIKVAGSAGEGEEDRQNVVGGGSIEARRLRRRIGCQ